MVLVVSLGDLFGYAAVVLIAATGVFMMGRRLLLRHTKNIDLLRRVHIVLATLGGVFLVLHASFFISYPITDPVLLGYASAAVAVFVWMSGTAFLERFRDSLFYHGSMSLTAVALMSIHAASSGINLPLWLASGVILVTVAVLAVRAWRHAGIVVKEVLGDESKRIH